MADIRVASTEAFFSLPETRIGMMPDLGGSVRMTRLVGAANAAWLSLSGRRIDTDKALSWGLVQESCPPGQSLAVARALVADICKGAPKATRLAVEAIRQAAILPLDQALELETQRGADALVSGEAPIGLAAFAERKAPRWT